MGFGIYTEETARRIHNAVLGSEPISGDELYGPDYESRWFYAKLTETLLYPDTGETNPEETGYTTATANVLKYTSDLSSHDREEVTTQNQEITITNRNPMIFAAKGDYLWVTYRDAEFVPLGVVRGEVDAVLTSALSAATSALTSPATATFKILHPNSSGNLVVTSWQETLTHRYEHISLPLGTYITVKRLNGEWRLSGADCDVSSMSTSGGDTSLLGEQP
jgi:hypothetical protein